MRILYPANIRLPSERAGTIQIANTCHALARQGAQVELAVRRMDGIGDREALAFYGLEPTPGLALRRLPVVNLPQARIWNGSYYLSLALWFSVAARRGRFDFVYSREPLAVRLFDRTRGWHRARIIYELHELPASVMGRYHSLLSGQAPPAEPLPKDAQEAGRVCQAADGVVALTHHIAAALREILGVQCPITVIPDGATVGEAPPEAAAQEEPFICYTGQLYRWKGLDTLIQAMDYLEGRVKLLIVGGRPRPEGVDLVEMAELHRTIAASRRAQDIVLTGFVEPSQVWRYQARCRVAVLTLSDDTVPRYCNSPLKLFEYMAAGRPIVASRLPAIEEVLTDGENALLVEPNDPQALAAAIDRLLAEPDLARRLGERAFADAHRYSWEERARAILAFATGLRGGRS